MRWWACYLIRWMLLASESEWTEAIKPECRDIREWRRSRRVIVTMSRSSSSLRLVHVATFHVRSWLVSVDTCSICSLKMLFRVSMSLSLSRMSALLFSRSFQNQSSELSDVALFDSLLARLRHNWLNPHSCLKRVIPDWQVLAHYACVYVSSDCELRGNALRICFSGGSAQTDTSLMIQRSALLIRR